MSCKSWTYPETQALLDIWQQDHIQTQLTLMARNRPVWEQVAEIMKYRKGFNRSGEQCKTRIHTLKIRYNRAKKYGLSGPEAEKECPFYRQLDAVLGKNWIKKDKHKTPSPTSLSSASSITSLYPLTFANDMDRISHTGMMQLLPKPVPKYMDTTFAKLCHGDVPTTRFDDVLGEHSKLLKKMIAGLSKKDQTLTTGEELYLGDTDHVDVDELIKSLVYSPVNGTLIPHEKTAFTSPRSPTALQGEDRSPVTVTSSNITEEEREGEGQPPASKRRKVSEESISKFSDKLILLGAMAQIVNNVNELTRSVKLAQDQEEKRLQHFVKMQEQRVDLEKEHYINMEKLFTSFIGVMTKETCEKSQE